MRLSIFFPITALSLFSCLGFAQQTSTAPVYKDIVPAQRQASDFYGPAFDVYQNDLAFGANLFDISTDAGKINDAGIVHIFSKVDNIWKQTQTLQSDNPSEEAWFGSYISIRKNILLITEHRAIKEKKEYEGIDNSIRNSFIHIYTKVNGAWKLSQKIEEQSSFYQPTWINDSSFVCGVPFANKVIVYKLSGEGVWGTTQTITNKESVYQSLFGSNTLISNEFLIIAEQNFGDMFGSRPGKVHVYTFTNGEYKLAYSISNPNPTSNAFGANFAVKDSLLLISSPLYSKDINQYRKGWVGIYKLGPDKAELIQEILNKDLASQTLGKSMLFYKNSLFLSKSIYSKPDELIEYKREKNSFVAGKKYILNGSDIEALKHAEGKFYYFVVSYESLPDGTNGRTGKVIEMSF